MASQQSTSKAERKNRKQTASSTTQDPRNAHKEDQVTNAEEQKEIINEPNYKTDREEEVTNSTPERTDVTDNPEADKKQPEAEA